MLSLSAFAFFAIFYPFQYFLFAVICLFLTFWTHAPLKPHGPNTSPCSSRSEWFFVTGVTDFKSAASASRTEYVCDR